MRAMVLDGRGAGRSRGRSSCATCPCPSRLPGEVLVKVRACGVCRTDLHVVEGELPDPKLPLVPGHQIVGTVERWGRACEGLARRRPRRRAMARRDGRHLPVLPRRDARTSATRPTFTGYRRDGGYAEYATARADFVLPLPDGLPRSAGRAAAVRRG